MAPNSTGGAYSALPRPLAGVEGARYFAAPPELHTVFSPSRSSFGPLKLRAPNLLLNQSFVMPLCIVTIGVAHTCP